MGAAGPTITSERTAEIFDRAAGKRAIVLGDMVLDEHIIGVAQRLSREAPLPVIEQRERLLIPGAATNVATNLRTLGCDVTWPASWVLIRWPTACELSSRVAGFEPTAWCPIRTG